MNDIKELTENKSIWLLYGLAGFLTIIVIYYEWLIGSVLTVVLAYLIYLTYRNETKNKQRTENYISTLSYRVKKVGEEALLEMPYGIILFSEDYQIEWCNPYMNHFMDGEQSLIGETLADLSDPLAAAVKDEDEEQWITLDDRQFQAIIKSEERLIYLFDRTDHIELENRYDNERTIIGVIFLDNYEELTQAMDDTSKSHLNSEVTSILNSWSNDYGIHLKRTSQERFIAVMNKEILTQLEKTKFEILDEVRELISDQNVPLTLSIGIGRGSVDLPELGDLAQSSLDLALGRGGDQVAIKDESGRVKFYGGKTNPMEKRTRVRARVISHALRELVMESEKVLIMGHVTPDMDSIGSSIGILKLAQQNGKKGYVVFDPDGVNTGVQRLMDRIGENDDLAEWFITPEDSLDVVTKNTLIVVVDTHKPSMVMEERLLSKTEHIVVIDHHRRGEEFVEEPTLVYMEPYASSTAELVTELLEYQDGPLKLDVLEATALLAGITVDTKSFTLRTGSRTFDAASYLRSKGADTVLVQNLLKEDIDLYIKRSELVKNATVYREGVAIAKGLDDGEYGTIIIAQAADTLLTMSNVKASFVIANRKDGKIGVSARSLGEINVQVIMEKMNGGGHLTNAATQLDDTTLEQVEEQLRDIIEEYFEGGED
ncbi:DHH family phosphoesterase [Tenuibacillus multivorans]|uniref:Cyclic-di-AMP phosphodiesterase n=1 Tax=Tenuibacillus multivorans TaxID=237069 RepID=A0A1G9W899_9BACI|nr:DHH family phosphoesterase [Tenuibacillus multivorans]GEL76343.1 cyclic-di-AMP phosphodiesterase GdpP [Tenuibacillus multivorans]SDM80471.1 c-di-AMP phosphodiesterase, consists of a GGDEF-like and DHH domains [Tenuibacillus multivorans]